MAPLDEDLGDLAEALGCDPADLSDDPPGAAVPRAGAPDGGCPAPAGGMPPAGLAPGAPCEPALEVARGPAADGLEAPAQKDLTPLEPGDGNRVINDGNPPAPAIDPRRGGLTEKQRAALDYKLAHFDATDKEVAKAAGMSGTQVASLMKRPQARLYMSAYLDAAGATLELAARVVKDAQDAVKRQPIVFEGKITDIFEQPDHEQRLKAARMSMEAHGVLEERGSPVVNFYQGLSDEALAAIAAGHKKPSDFIESEAVR